ncbi:restriction endonuclease fold toxin-2 domain-containing protein [Kitasatospora sp. NPDC048365]|uniref:restriction endonuclease fold toxin-2 domain-containing protein n=1 Tax=Kitasatospora sp. NPDC048365 TaxID=3364050 RepID=UPI00371B4F69
MRRTGVAPMLAGTDRGEGRLVGNAAATGGGGFVVDPSTVFRASVQFLDTKDFVYDIAAGVAADLSSSAGMAGDDSIAHSFAGKYEPAARTIVKAIGTAGQGMAAISGRLLTMAVNYLKAEDAIAAALTGNIQTSSATAQRAQECEPSEAYSSLPMVTGSKEVHEIPVIGKFWPQGDPERLRHAGEVWARCASLIDDAQVNAGRHAAEVMAQCTGAAFDAFAAYAATVYAARPHGGKDVASSLPLMENTSAACREMQSICVQYADAIETCRNTLIGLGVAAGVITAAGIILTVFTLGGSDAAAVAADAALAADAAVAVEALAVAEAELAAAAAVAEAEAVVAALAARLAIAAGVAAAVTAVPAVMGLDSASAATPPGPTNPTGAGSPPAAPGVGPVPPPIPPPFPLYGPAEQFAASTWVAGLPSRLPNYGNADDRAYQLRVAGTPEHLMPGANGETVWADGFRPSDGAIIDAKNVRKQGCSPRTLEGLQESRFNTNLLLSGDESELSRYQAAIDNPANHAQYLEIDTNDPQTVGYWQYLLAAHHVKSNVRVVP